MRIILHIALSMLLSGCSSFQYYMDAVNGHQAILEKSQPIDEVLEQETDNTLRQRLKQIQQARVFASEQLLLPDNNSYKSYVDIGREYVTWNIVATPRFSVTPKQWCFLVVGCLGYRGYYDKNKAMQMFDELKSQGFDVYMAGVKAYSTLGWTDDPVLNTMLYENEAYRVGVLFHELAHQKLYIKDDSGFNEAFATTIEIEGIKRWFEKHGNRQGYTDFIESRNRQVAFHALLGDARTRLNRLYKQDMSETDMLDNKTHVFEMLQTEYADLKKSWGGYGGYDNWMKQDLNNAHLATVSTYYDLVPAFQKILNKNDGNLKVFYKRINDIARLSKEQRDNVINRYLKDK